MSLTKLMKEEGKRSKSASPVVIPPTEGVKVEKRKPEEELDDEDLSKRARLAAGVAAEVSVPQPQPQSRSQPIMAEDSAQSGAELVTPNLTSPVPEPETSLLAPNTNGVTEIEVKKEPDEGGHVDPVPEVGADRDEDEDAVDSSVLVKNEPDPSLD